jgi:ACS family glucarate transporter-like MFS transporter
VDPGSVPSPVPTRARYGVVLFAVALAVVQYIDRICISKTGPTIQKDLHLDDVEMGYVFGAFTLAYALFEIPTGWLGDRFGPRKILVRVCLWWSFFTAATGWAWNYGSMVVIRFLFGIGEAGCFPNITKAFSTWLRPEEKVRAQSILWLCARWGGAITPLLVVAVLKLDFMTWRRAFMFFGTLGILWAIFFYRWFRDDPRDHPSVNEAERDLLASNRALGSTHEAVPWKGFASSKTAWLLWAQYFCLSYSWYFYITWLPKYMKEVRDLDLTKGALLAGLPLFCGGFGSLLAGFAVTPLARWTGSMIRARRLLARTGFYAAAALLIASYHIEHPVLAMVTMGLAGFFNDMVMPGAWGACMDVGGKFAGTFSGSMNMMGNLGGALGPVAVGYILKETYKCWGVTFYLSAAIYLLGGLCWLYLDPVTPLTQDEKQPAAAPAS